MAFKKIEDNEQRQRKKKIVERFKNRVPLPSMKDRKQQDVYIIDTALSSLYNEGDKVTRSLQDDILIPNQIRISEKDAGRIWDIMINTGLVHSIIGFGNAGKLSLTNEGYQLMSQFGSYSAFLEEKDKQQQGPQMMFPQFIIEPADGKEGGEKEEGEGEQKAVGKA
ncbi:hypothetical protein [Taibaiella koreensis]|uniref:hypothetical protein n=1 Tax=Taibaiella koreensis TaxID=1268548 RepID=UPI000E59D2B3|nr:hypothetical protein [Taibaiella koreensis]